VYLDDAPPALTGYRLAAMVVVALAVPVLWLGSTSTAWPVRGEFGL
jgi:hypothetical protein